MNQQEMKSYFDILCENIYEMIMILRVYLSLISKLLNYEFELNVSIVLIPVFQVDKFDSSTSRCVFHQK
jgi:hypothetical protein